MWLCYLACSYYSKRNFYLSFGPFNCHMLVSKIEIIVKVWSQYLGWFLYIIISVDRFNIITPQGIGKGIKEEKIQFGLVFIACTCINLGIEFSTLAWKETFTGCQGKGTVDFSRQWLFSNLETIIVKAIIVSGNSFLFW